MGIKRFFGVSAAVVLGALTSWADVSVTAVEAQQRYPWNGLVDIAVTLQGAQADVANTRCTFAASNTASATALTVSSVLCNGPATGSGTTWTRRYVWDTATDLAEDKIDDLVLTVDAQPDGVQLWEGGPYWSELNVGAATPESSGYYFGWGDTNGYVRTVSDDVWVSVKDGTTFDFLGDNCATCGKDRNALLSAGYGDAIGKLAVGYDGARAHRGGAWRMPTGMELIALTNRCNLIHEVRNGVSGWLVTGKDAYSANRLFLPAAGFGSGSCLNGIGADGCYWSSQANLADANSAFDLRHDATLVRSGNDPRSFGLCIRPVRGDLKTFTLTLTPGTGLSALEVTLWGGKIPYAGPMTLEAGTPITVSGAVKAGYSAYAGEAVTMSGDVTKTISVTPITYSISYELYGGTVSPPNPTEYTVETEAFTLDNPKWEGHTFHGWSGTGISKPTPYVTIAKGSVGDRVYTAMWEFQTYNITYYLNGGTVSDNPKTYHVNVDTFTLNNPTRPGYMFAGWTGTGISGTAMTVTIPKGSTGDCSFTATWTPINYSITYKLNGGTVSPANPETYTVETETFTLNNPTNAGYTFEGWTGTNIIEATKTVKIAKGSMGDREYAATWTRDTYTITYDLNGGTLKATNPSEYHVESPSFTLVNPTRDAYTFVGWTGTGLSEPTIDVTIATGSAGNRDYKATWTPTPYTITYELNGGTVVPANTNSYTIESATFTLRNPWKADYVFTGWQGTDIYGSTMTVTIAKGTTGTRSYTATWRPANAVQLWANGPYWAECNVGASTPEDFGYYFWWGDTGGYQRNEKDTGWVSVKDGETHLFNYLYCPTSLKESNELKSLGWIDNSNNLTTGHDAARVHFGKPWRMPTRAEFAALTNNCTAAWVTQNGVQGLRVSGTGAYASQSIFMPLAGYGRDDFLNRVNSVGGNYWSSTLYSSNNWKSNSGTFNFAKNMFSEGFYYRTSEQSRDFGLPVRPVRTE